MKSPRNTALRGLALAALLSAGCFPSAADALATTEEALDSSAQLAPPLTPAAQVTQLFSGGYSTFAIKSDGTLWAWGLNQYGQLGLGDKLDRSSPTQVPGISGIKKFSTGEEHACAIKTDGTLWCWGGNYYGQLGLGDTTDRTTPTQVTRVLKVKQFTLGGAYTCVTKTDNTLWCWGGDKPFGYPDGLYDTSTPTQVLTNVASAALGHGHICATRTDGTLWCWGDNLSGDVGVDFGVATNSPVQIAGIPDIKKITLNYNGSMVLQSDGTLWAWGGSDEGQLGGVAGNLPQKITSSAHFLQVSLGDQHACGTKSGGALWCWGANAYGQLGLGGTSAPHTTPTQIPGITNVSQIAIGYDSTLILKTDGSVWSWGNNTYGELGVGDKVKRLLPTQLTF